ncbi:cytochrome P450 [Dactylosporangium sp. CS-033363]|uniref:cytochrome P450 n=1 Tax=Dactylosporangium sp. CS-033363 TaxID=3239935 RepID=UPI003D91ABEF
MADTALLDRILDQAGRADPYPLYARLRETPVLRRPDGTYVVSTYHEVVALLHDPRVSSDPRHHPGGEALAESGEGLPMEFIRLDPPAHDRLRDAAMRPFGPPQTPGRIQAMRPWLTGLAGELLDGLAGRGEAELVAEFAYPLPVAAICRLLDVPRSDQPRFSAWADALIRTFDPATGSFVERQQARNAAVADLGDYLARLVDGRAGRTGEDLISGMLADAGPHGAMTRGDVVATSVLLLVAGHETTVNLIANGILTLLRRPEHLERLRADPDRVVPLVEELLRYEPPVHMLTGRSALADIEILGTTIPAGSELMLMLAAASRDPARFAEPDGFDPDRPDNEHLGYGSGIHYCFGAPLARIETQVALLAFADRVKNPRLVTDPPPYRPNPALRGPSELRVAFDG